MEDAESHHFCLGATETVRLIDWEQGLAVLRRTRRQVNGLAAQVNLADAQAQHFGFAEAKRIVRREQGAKPEFGGVLPQLVIVALLKKGRARLRFLQVRKFWDTGDLRRPRAVPMRRSSMLVCSNDVPVSPSWNRVVRLPVLMPR